MFEDTIHCPKCHVWHAHLADIWQDQSDGLWYARYVCQECGHRFDTSDEPDQSTPVQRLYATIKA